jgi:hypothetical protein
MNGLPQQFERQSFGGTRTASYPSFIKDGAGAVMEIEAELRLGGKTPATQPKRHEWSGRNGRELPLERSPRPTLHPFRTIGAAI